MAKDTTRERERIVQVQCPDCGGDYRKHTVLHLETVTSDPEEGFYWARVSQMVKCRGCDAIRLHVYELADDKIDPFSGHREPYNIHVSPHLIGEKHAPIDHNEMPKIVARIYSETIGCRQAGAATLTGAGLRAIVEAVCINQGVTGRSLQERIDALAQDGLLAKAQAGFLHEARYLGNAALHEIEAPSEEEIQDGLTIIEGLLKTIYVLPVRAKRLRENRESTKKSNLDSSDRPT